MVPCRLLRIKSLFTSSSRYASKLRIYRASDRSSSHDPTSRRPPHHRRSRKESPEIGQPMNIAVADAGGNLISHVRMEQRLDRLHRHLHQESLDLPRLRHRHQRPRRALPIWQPVLRHPRLQRRPGHDLRRRHPSQARRQSRRGHRRQRRLWSPGPRSRRSRCSGSLVPISVRKKIFSKVGKN